MKRRGPAWRKRGGSKVEKKRRSETEGVKKNKESRHGCVPITIVKNPRRKAM